MTTPRSSRAWRSRRRRRWRSWRQIWPTRSNRFWRTRDSLPRIALLWARTLKSLLPCGSWPRRRYGRGKVRRAGGGCGDGQWGLFGLVRVLDDARCADTRAVPRTVWRLLVFHTTGTLQQSRSRKSAPRLERNAKHLRLDAMLFHDVSC